MQQAQPQETLKSDPSFDGSTKVFSSKGSMKSENLKKPLFVLADWTTWFLPTLYHFLFCSEKPFHEFGKGSAFVTTVQEILDIIHPGNTYIVTSSCKIYTTVMYLFLCLIHSLMKPLNCRHMIRSLKNGLISEHKLCIWSIPISNAPNSQTTPAQLPDTQDGPQERMGQHCGGFLLPRARVLATMIIS